MSTTILLVRHGQTEWNRVERFRGQYNVELNATGIEQAKKTALGIGKRWQPAAILCSPLKRAVQTAEAIAQVCALTVQPDPGLIDIHYGEWQGLTPDEVREKFPDRLTDWYEHPERAAIPGGERLAEVQGRSMSVLLAAAKQYSDQVIVAVSHTVVNRLVLLRVLGLGIEAFWRLRQEPCAINVIEISPQNFVLGSMNDTCHLQD